MAQIVNGRLVSDSVSDVLDALVVNFEAETGDSLPAGVASALRVIYLPVAEELVSLQDEMAQVLDSSQLDFASGGALDLLTALVGIPRREATNAAGTVTFSRATSAGIDYTVPVGTEVQTDSSEPVSFVTTEEVTLLSGTTSVDASIEAVEAGSDGNVASGTITVMKSSVSGIEAVDNTNPTTGGFARETDEELRARAKLRVSTGVAATAGALRDAVADVAGVQRADIVVNNSSNTVGGISPHAFEIIADGGSDGDVAQAILDTMGAGFTPDGGANGTLVSTTGLLPGGQTEPVEFSRPIPVQVYVDVDVVTTAEYEGNDAVREAIVRYTSGTLPSAAVEDGVLEMGDEVLIGEIEYAIRTVPGVYDVTDLRIGRSASPTGAVNIPMLRGETPFTDATDGSLTITTNPVA